MKYILVCLLLAGISACHKDRRVHLTITVGDGHGAIIVPKLGKDTVYDTIFIRAGTYDEITLNSVSGEKGRCVYVKPENWWKGERVRVGCFYFGQTTSLKYFSLSDFDLGLKTNH